LRIGDEVYDEVSRPKMSEKVLESMISQYLSYRFSESIFGWQGGEPTLAGLDFFKKAVSLQQEYGESGQVVGNALQTNGILIDEEWAKFLHQYRFLVGLSLDGPKGVHDRYRRTRGGKSVWKKVMRAAELFQRYNVQFNILCVVSRANVNRIEEVYNFFLDHNFNHIQFIPALETDEKGNKATFSINPNQYGKFLCSLFDLWKRNPNQASIRFFDAILSYYLGYPKGECTLEKDCAEYLLVEHNGDVYPCDFFVQEKYKVGNILQTSLANLKQKRARSFEKRKHTLSENCKTCNWLELCYGGCIKDRVFEANSHPEKTYFCDAYKHFFDHAAHWFQAQAKQIRSRRPRS
jgi:uncharacterized protein